MCTVMVAPAAAVAPIILIPSVGHVDTVVTVTATGFAPGTFLTTTFDGVTVTTAPPAVKTGAVTPAIVGGATFSFRVPAAGIGGRAVRVSDGVTTHSATFTIEQRVTISPIAGPKGSTATASVTGFAAGVSVDVFAGATLVGSGKTDGKGSATVSLTMRAAGLITARDGAGNGSVHHPHIFAFTPGITLDPTTGLGGITVTIEGRDFTPGGSLPIVGITFAGTVVPLVPLLVAIPFTDRDADGMPDDFRATITIPPGATAGRKVIRVTDAAGLTTTATFDVIGPAIGTITLDPKTGVAGQSVRVTGVHFPRLKWVSLRFADRGTALARLKDPGGSIVLASAVPIDSLGNLHPTTVTIPLVTPARYEIWAVVEDDIKVAAPIADDASFEVKAPKVVTGVRDGLNAVWGQLGESVWQFKDGKWYQHFIAQPGIVPEAVRLTELETGKAYWIYLTRDITNVHFGGAKRTLKAGWHNIAWQ